MTKIPCILREYDCLVKANNYRAKNIQVFFIMKFCNLGNVCNIIFQIKVYRKDNLPARKASTGTDW